jgi:CRP/FNR family transcriptional regulator, cyclic AMP receptor protein
MISDSLLQGVYLFKELTAEERTSLTRIAEEMNLPAGFSIFRAGDSATALYLIKDGSVRIAVIAANGERIDVATIGSGSHFGEMALIDGANRSATAETLEPTHMFRFDYDKITALLDRSPATAARLYRSMARFLSNRLRQTTTDMSFAREKNLRYF